MAVIRYLVSYDIADPRRLRRVAKVVQSYGTRIQFSVFECLLNPTELAQLRVDLSDVIEPDEDQILFIRLASPSAKDADLLIVSLGLPYTRRSSVSIV